MDRKQLMEAGPPPFRKLLVANRGEIAVRILRACRDLGIAGVAVFSDVDRASLHVRLADEAYPIGTAAPRESYLNIDKLMDVAIRSGCDALHPGYGFLAENPNLPRACAAAGITFVGPSAAAMELLGSKTAARQLAHQAGVPMVPGVREPVARLEDAGRIAREIGYPVLLKAVAGGGGKGMRVVTDASELAAAWREAGSEALNAFGDASVYIERYLERPRHIEIQIFGDAHGSIVYLGERECSVQRRHQKVIEESPSPFVTPELRRSMGEAAVRLAQAAGYTNAGTAEFLVDAQRNFYFLEVNTRLQVEHPVTEACTGLDLVKLQLHVAAGRPLPLRRIRPPLHPGMPSNAVSMPKIPKMISTLRPAASHPGGRRRDPEFVWMMAFTRVGLCRPITILCWLNSSHGEAIAAKPCVACAARLRNSTSAAFERMLTFSAVFFTTPISSEAKHTRAGSKSGLHR